MFMLLSALELPYVVVSCVTAEDSSLALISQEKKKKNSNAGIRLHNIFLFHDGHYVRLSNHSAMTS